MEKPSEQPSQEILSREDIKVGMKIQSFLDGMKGEVTNLTKNEVTITWDHPSFHPTSHLLSTIGSESGQMKIVRCTEK